MKYSPHAKSVAIVCVSVLLGYLMGTFGPWGESGRVEPTAEKWTKCSGEDADNSAAQPKDETAASPIKQVPKEAKQEVIPQPSRPNNKFSLLASEAPFYIDDYHRYPNGTDVTRLIGSKSELADVVSSWWSASTLEQMRKVLSSDAANSMLDSSVIESRRGLKLVFESHLCYTSERSRFAFLKYRSYRSSEFLGSQVMALRHESGIWKIAPVRHPLLYKLYWYFKPAGFLFLVTGRPEHLTPNIDAHHRRRIERLRADCSDVRGCLVLRRFWKQFEELELGKRRKDWESLQILMPKKVKYKDHTTISLTSEQEKIIRSELDDLSREQQDKIISLIREGLALTAARRIKDLRNSPSLFENVKMVNNWLGKERIKVTRQGSQVKTVVDE